MNEEKNSEAFYEKLKAQLYDTGTWPSEYLYKFIVVSEAQKIAEVEAIFNDMGAVLTTNESKTGKYTSVSVSVRLENPEAVIEKYKEVAEKVEGVISL